MLDETDLPDRITIIHRPAGPLSDDIYGNPDIDWTTAPRDEDIPANVQVASVDEDSGDRARRKATLDVWLLPGTAISALDRVEYRDEMYQVDGDPEIRRMDGVEQHVKIALTRTDA